MVSNFKEKLQQQVDKYYMNDITGAKVKIKMKNFENRPKSTKFEKFLSEANEKVFTAELDVEMGYTKMYTLAEDTSDVKWLFHIEDLELV